MIVPSVVAPTGAGGVEPQPEDDTGDGTGVVGVALDVGESDGVGDGVGERDGAGDGGAQAVSATPSSTRRAVKERARTLSA